MVPRTAQVIAGCPAEPGYFLIARMVPIGIGWMLSGTTQTLGPAQRAAALQVAAELAAGHPWLVFRNPHVPE
jgi:hypothetical protein